MEEGEGKGGEGRGRSTCLPPRFDNPGYGLVHVPPGDYGSGGVLVGLLRI